MVDQNEGIEDADPYFVITTPNWTTASTETERNYTIYFENKATATASAQEVFVSTALPVELDWSTFELRAVGAGDEVYTVMNGETDGTWIVAQKSTGDSIQISVEYDPRTGEVNWYLRSYVASTEDHFPTDPYDGFLPPNDESGAGEGYVSFAIKYAKGLSTGTRAYVAADIVFDENETITTNVWHTTIDASAPTSHIVSTRYDNETRTINVQWTGEDADSGIASYDVYYSVDGGGEYELWLERTTLTEADFNVAAIGENYSFKVVAYDGAGNCNSGVTASIRVEADALVRLDESTFVVQEGCDVLVSAITSGASDEYSYYWNITGEGYALANDYVELGESFWFSARESALPSGEYVVSLRVRDASGVYSAPTSATLRVVEVDPTFEIDARGLMGDQALSLAIKAQTPNDVPISQWRIDWGDGETSIVDKLGDAIVASHYYPETAGETSYSVTLEAIDARGKGAGTYYAIATHSVPGTGVSTAVVEEQADTPQIAEPLAAPIVLATRVELSPEHVATPEVSTDAAPHGSGLAVVLTTETESFSRASSGEWSLALPEAADDATLAAAVLREERFAALDDEDDALGFETDATLDEAEESALDEALLDVLVEMEF